MKKEVALSLLMGIGVTALSANSEATPAWAKNGVKAVKCKGVAKKGQNDCGANGHSCEAKAAKDNDPNEWIFVPEGLCEKIAGGVAWK